MPSEPNQYELQRQQLIARNRARLQALGITSAATALHEASVAKLPAKTKKKEQKKAAVSQGPTRHSARLNPDAGGANSEASELALCVVNGTCPHCNKYVDVGHKRHLDQCSGSRKSKQRDTLGHIEIEGLDELEAEEARLHGNEEEADTRPAKKSKPSKSQAEKLKELELSGLVDFDKSHARFAVIGSTGSHYNVELKDPAPSCQCVDYRIRKRICKHQKLVLLQLGIPDAPQDWYKAVSSKLHNLVQAEPTDRQLHLEQAEVDPDHEEPAAESSKPAKAVATHGKPECSATGGRKANQQQHDRDALKGNSKESGDGDVQTGQEGCAQDTEGESAASRGGLSPGLAWPKRPPRGK